MTVLLQKRVRRLPWVCFGLFGVLAAGLWLQQLAATTRNLSGEEHGPKLAFAIGVIFAAAAVRGILYGLVAPEHRVSVDDGVLIIRDRYLKVRESRVRFAEIRQVVFQDQLSFDNDRSVVVSLETEAGGSRIIRDYQTADATTLRDGLRAHAPQLEIREQSLTTAL